MNDTITEWRGGNDAPLGIPDHKEPGGCWTECDCPQADLFSRFDLTSIPFGGGMKWSG